MSNERETIEDIEAYIDARTALTQTKYDETSGQLLVNTPQGWVPVVPSSSLGASPPLVGSIPLHSSYTGTSPPPGNAVLTLQGNGYGADWISVNGGSSYAQLATVLNKLLNAVVAGACCRCAPTEVCPECHDLNEASDAARRALEGLSVPVTPYRQTDRDGHHPALYKPADNVVTLSGDTHVTGDLRVEGSLNVTGGLTVSGTALQLATTATIKAGT